ncbi:hypothetical protein GCM10017576_00650 [Microbacterium barkeri]|uniref:Uncharacterized protein n=1 Tax=Microbacterium barkeri TaxID=33917 RepID=A0A9W6LV60_9MICO|nr:hypothetical protein GCM10017576_00650 [Microbacterium barkeri]
MRPLEDDEEVGDEDEGQDHEGSDLEPDRDVQAQGLSEGTTVCESLSPVLRTVPDRDPSVEVRDDEQALTGYSPSTIRIPKRPGRMVACETNALSPDT